MDISSTSLGVPPPERDGTAHRVGARLTASLLENPSDRRPCVTPLSRSTRGLLAALVALLAGCDPYVRGDGRYDEEARTVPPFAGVRVEDRLSVFVTAGSAQSVTVSGDANLVRDSIKTRLVDPVVVGTQAVPVLRVYVDLDDWVPTIPPRVVITVPTFSYVDASGASLVEVKAAPASTFRVRAAGESVVTLVGPAGAGELELELDDAALEADTYPVALGTSLRLGGGSTAKLYSNGPVTGSVSGNGFLDNRLGAGSCLGVAFAGGATACCVDVKTDDRVCPSPPSP